MTILECLNMQEPLQSLIDKDLPFAVAYKVSKIIEAVNKELDFYYKNLTKLINTYGEKDEEGKVVQQDGNYKIAAENINKFQADVNELVGVAVKDIECKLNITDLEAITIKPKDIILLKPIIEE